MYWLIIERKKVGQKMMISSIIRIHDKNNTKNSEISYDLDDDCQTDL